MRRAVFLDRDGVINRAIVRDGRPYPPSQVEEAEILPGVWEALSSLKAARFHLIVVTNQPDVSRGAQLQERVEAIHEMLASNLPIDAFKVCYHDDGDRCACRKPSPGMLQEAALERGIDLKASYLVGDRWRDIEAGRRAGCKTILIDYGYAERELNPPDHRVHSLAEAAKWILSREAVP
jgi:D-glycero-D-manno-heptose 1,7-bisphosphate phosphatase